MSELSALYRKSARKPSRKAVRKGVSKCVIPGATYYTTKFGEFVSIKMPLAIRDLRADISKNTVQELKYIAKYLKIKGYGDLNKKDLVNAIIKAC